MMGFGEKPQAALDRVQKSLYQLCTSGFRQLRNLSTVWRPRRDLNPCYRRERAMS